MVHDSGYYRSAYEAMLHDLNAPDAYWPWPQLPEIWRTHIQLGHTCRRAYYAV